MHSRTLLSWTVRRVNCSCCGTSDLTFGVLNQIALFLEHGGHLRSVTLDLLLVEPGEATGLTMTLPLVPAHIRLMNLN